tara:strand:+ start:104 stop:397 length:294 start_codon:yes stop_codon:yes gene_type:complete
MPYYKKSEYTLINIQKSDRPSKKYTAVLQQKPAGKIVYVHFGALGYEQFRDSTKLKLYKKYDHGDRDRKKKYIARHQGFIKLGYYSPGYFAMRYLWT